MSHAAIAFDDVLAARERLRDITHVTPMMRSRTADQQTGAQLFFKCENLQRVGAFKFRGAYNALAQFTPAQKAHGVVTYSSGNHAQAIALAAQLFGMPAAVIMPADAPKTKTAATRGYGAQIIPYDRYRQDREPIAQQLMRERGMTLIPPFDHPHVIAGQGTVTLECLEQAGDLDIIVTPLGGGGLLSGAALVARALQPNCQVFGVEPEAANDGQQSLRAGKIVRIATPNTIADGAQTQALGQHTFPIIQRAVDEIVTVSDAELIDAMRFFAARMKLIVEPTGCLAAAAVLTGKIPVAGKRVGIVLSGGNVDLDRFAALIAAHDA